MANLNTLMIYIDASRYSNTGRRTGVENYSFFLINELIKEHGREITLISPRKLRFDVKQIIIPFPRLWTLLRLSWEIWRNKAIDNLFVPSHVLPIILPQKSVITIHDVVFKYSPESYSFFSRVYLDWATRYAVKHATGLIVPSRATKEDLIKFYKARPEKISVIPLGFKSTEIKTGKKDSERMLNKFGLKPKNFFLYIGRIEYKKNTDTLIQAFETFCRQNTEIKLVLAGFLGHGGKEILKKISFEINDKLVLTGYVSDSEKTALMRNALCFVFPSRFEGFGLPLLEAMEANLPIIASDIPSSREVAAENALFFKKNDPGALAELFSRVSAEPKPDIEFTKNHQSTLKNYSWARCADEVYKKIKA